MGLIKKELEVAGSLHERVCEVLFDTGASASFVRKNVAEEIAQILKTPHRLSFKLGDESVFSAEHTTVLHINIDGHSLPHIFLVVPKLPYEVIIGADFLQRWKIKLDPSTEEFIVDEKSLEIILV